MKQEHKKTFKGRLLAWVLTFAMLCTGMNVTAFAQDMSFDDGTITEVQTEEPENYEADGTDEISSEVTEDQSTADETEITDETEIQEDQNEDALSDGKSQTDVFSDGAQEDQFSDAGTTDESNTSVTVYFSVSDDEVYLSNTESLPGPVSLQKLTVPYFDLAMDWISFTLHLKTMVQTEHPKEQRKQQKVKLLCSICLFMQLKFSIAE